MNREEAAHIVDVAFSVPQAVRRIGEEKTYHEGEIREAKNMAIDALETIGHLTDRPCGVCEYHGEYGCCKWDCVFKGV